jgi:hypothetical protein
MKLLIALLVASCSSVETPPMTTLPISPLPADSIKPPAAPAPAAPSSPGVPGDSDWPYVYIDGGACETGVMDMVIVMAKMPCDPTVTPMCEIPHPQFPRVQHGACFYQSWSASKYATLIRCVDPNGVDLPSAWVGPVDMVNTVPMSQCLRIRN